LWTDFQKNTQTSNFMKIRPEGDELFQPDGRTDRLKDGRIDMKKLTVNFHNFVIAPNKQHRPNKATVQVPQEFKRA
jgi:hypothetical protein